VEVKVVVVEVEAEEEAEEEVEVVVVVVEVEAARLTLTGVCLHVQVRAKSWGIPSRPEGHWGVSTEQRGMGTHAAATLAAMLPMPSRARTSRLRAIFSSRARSNSAPARRTFSSARFCPRLVPSIVAWALVEPLASRVVSVESQKYISERGARYDTFLPSLELARCKRMYSIRAGPLLPWTACLFHRSAESDASCDNRN